MATTTKAKTRPTAASVLATAQVRKRKAAALDESSSSGAGISQHLDSDEKSYLDGPHDTDQQDKPVEKKQNRSQAGAAIPHPPPSTSSAASKSNGTGKELTPSQEDEKKLFEVDIKARTAQGYLCISNKNLYGDPNCTYFARYRIHPKDESKSDIGFKLYTPKSGGGKPYVRPFHKRYPDKPLKVTIPFGVLGRATDAWPFGNFVDKRESDEKKWVYWTKRKDGKYLTGDINLAKLKFQYRNANWSETKTADGNLTTREPDIALFQRWIDDFSELGFRALIREDPKIKEDFQKKREEWVTYDHVGVENKSRKAQGLSEITTQDEREEFYFQKYCALEFKPTWSNGSIFIDLMTTSKFAKAWPEDLCKNPSLKWIVDNIQGRGAFYNTVKLLDARGRDIPLRLRSDIGEGDVVSFCLQPRLSRDAQDGTKHKKHWAFDYDYARLLKRGVFVAEEEEISELAPLEGGEEFTLKAGSGMLLMPPAVGMITDGKEKPSSSSSSSSSDAPPTLESSSSSSSFNDGV